jgi:hypothetical protein
MLGGRLTRKFAARLHHRWGTALVLGLFLAYVVFLPLHLYFEPHDNLGLADSSTTAECAKHELHSQTDDHAQRTHASVHHAFESRANAKSPRLIVAVIATTVTLELFQPSDKAQRLLPSQVNPPDPPQLSSEHTRGPPLA